MTTNFFGWLFDWAFGVFLFVAVLVLGATVASSQDARFNFDGFVREDATYGQPTFVNKPADAPIAAHGCATFQHLPLRQSVANQLKAADKCLIGLGNSFSSARVVIDTRD